MANEKRLIWADVAKEMIINHANEFSDVLNRREKALLIGGGTSCIDKCPTVDAVEVVHGEWIYENGEWVCSVCKEPALYEVQVYGGGNYKDCDLVRSSYCPKCGAKMDGDGNG